MARASAATRGAGGVEVRRLGDNKVRLGARGEERQRRGGLVVGLLILRSKVIPDCHFAHVSPWPCTHNARGQKRHRRWRKGEKEGRKGAEHISNKEGAGRGAKGGDARCARGEAIPRCASHSMRIPRLYLCHLECNTSARSRQPPQQPLPQQPLPPLSKPPHRGMHSAGAHAGFRGSREYFVGGAGEGPGARDRGMEGGKGDQAPSWSSSSSRMSW